MENTGNRAIAIVGLGAVLPDAPNVAAFWENIKTGRYSITEVTPDRWDPALYYDADPAAPDKSYSKIGGWVREHVWDPMKWHLPIPPRVAEAMDEAQKWAISCTRAALEDYGYPKRALDPDRTAVILGNAMAGEKHYLTALRVYFPEYARELAGSAAFAKLPESVRHDITEELHGRIAKFLPDVTEDSMPGELANCIAGRIANLYNFHGPNFVTDAACASAMAAFSAAVEGLVQRHYDYAITGGIDRNMGAPTFVKFCKIGALSGTGSRPYAEGADGFVMGEGTVIFLLKRLADAERDGDKVYAVIRGIAGASDGKGKGITAPNPIGQRLCVERAWQNAGLSPATATYIEGHGTSTRVGDVVEVQSIADVLKNSNVPVHTVALGSVKSNIGHLKGAAGAAGLLKTTLALHNKVLPPSVKFERPNPDIDFAHSPLYVNTELKEWSVPTDTPRRAGASAFGFGGTNFHVVLEEFIPGRINGNGKRSTGVVMSEVARDVDAPHLPPSADMGSAAHGFTTTVAKSTSASVTGDSQRSSSRKSPMRGALVIGAGSEAELIERLRAVQQEAERGKAPTPVTPADSDLRATERLTIDYGNAAELADKSARALKAFAANQPALWKALRAQGIFRGHGPAPKVAFLYTGQGSQYVNMMRGLLTTEPIVAQTFAEADRVMTPLLGKPLTDYIYVDERDAKALAKADDDLRQTAITQPAVLATDEAITRLLAAYGIRPDMTMGHSLGEYGALVASGAIPFDDALEAVSARGREMTRVSMADNGKMAAVFAPLSEIERIRQAVTGYVVVANINSQNQAVIGGDSNAVMQAMEMFLKAGYNAVALPVSHAFHTSIVAPASEPLRRMLERLRLQSPRVPIVANVDGEFYPTGPNAVPQMLDILARQIASPVQFVKGLQTLYEAGARVFIETGPKKALHGFVEDVLGDRGDVVSLFTNHPKLDDIVAFNQALCGLYAAGLGGAHAAQSASTAASVPAATSQSAMAAEMANAKVSELVPAPTERTQTAVPASERYEELGRLFAASLERGWEIYKGVKPTADTTPVVITGAALGLPGTERVFDDSNVERILRGDQFIQPIPTRFREAMLDKNITRLVKSNEGGPVFEAIGSIEDVIKLAARGGALDLEEEFGVSADRVGSLDRATRLAMGAGLDALRDAGIPLVMRYKTTSKGTKLPDRWSLPNELRDNTGVIFASAFPGYDSFADEMARYYADRSRRDRLAELESLRARRVNANGQTSAVAQEIESRIAELREAIEHERYVLDRRFLFRTLSMGHSQFAEFIGARGPNTQINSACASTAQAISLAEDWIRAGRCRRVVVLSADDVTSDNLMEWIGAGFLASGAAATDEAVEEAAIPFDRRRHGMVVGMGAAAMVIESADAARERGIRPICEVLSAVTANSAFHGSRLDVQHISEVMENTIAKAEQRSGICRDEIAPKTVFISHETYTPARGGSASAEIFALRRTFGDSANKIVIANTKGLTGHAMATGIEDVVAIKALETGLVPPVANFKEVDPELGELNLSKGGRYPVEYALRLGAGFGSQISITLTRWVQGQTNSRPSPDALGYAYRVQDVNAWNEWLARIAGHPAAELEVVHRTLRVRDQALMRAQPSRPEPAVKSATPTVITRYVPAKATAAGSGATPAAVASASATVTQIEVEKPVQTSAAPAAVMVPRAVPQPRAVEKVPEPVAQASADGSVRSRVLALVSEKTGYPVDMLDLDLDLEADLGVDTVKQAEVFASIREAYGIARDDTIRLRDFPTLAHVIRFVHERRPELAAGVMPTRAAESDPAEFARTEAITPRKEEELALPSHPAIGADDVKERILTLVVEKTGYPKDMLDLDLDLEADLGVDTVKQAEMFAAIREIYNIPRDQNLKLRDFPTLAHVIRFVYDRRPDLLASPEPQKPAATATTAASPASVEADKPKPEPAASATTQTTVIAEEVKERILTLVVEKTGYPKDMLDLDLDLEADLGVDTVKQAEMFAAIREIYNIPRDQNLKLRDFPSLAHVIKFVYERRPDLANMPAAPAVPIATAAAAVDASVAAVHPGAAATESVSTSFPDEAVKEKVLDIVAEKTGYPKDMLDLDLDLEADLGIDTVKQAEIFATMRAAFNISRDETLRLRDFPTLGHVITFATERRPSATAAVVAPPASNEQRGAEQPTPPPSQAVNVPARPVLVQRRPLASFDAANSIPRRVPVPVLRPPLDVCKQTGVELRPGSRVVLMPDQAGVADALTQELQSLGVEVLRLDHADTADELTATLKRWTSVGSINGVYWLPALDDEGPLTEMTLATWRDAVRIRVKSLYIVMRVLYDQVATAGTFLVAGTRLGGQHGYDRAGATAPMGGTVTGFTKTYKRERQDALVKAVDFAAESKASEIAQSLINETLRDPGAVEIGYKHGLRWTIGLQEQSATDGQSGIGLTTETVFLITGAAGSIVSAITADLAAASGGTFYLLDLVPEPDPDNPDIARFVSDKDGLKRDIFARIQASGQRATPAMVEKELAALERAHAGLSAINAVREAGGTAHYFSVNLTDADAVAKVIETVRKRSGRIDILLHAAGLERSHFLPDKDPREFDLVFDVKSDGWFNLLHATGNMPVGATVAFSSVAGRFGNAGQTDYSAANDLLCKITSSFRTTRPSTRGIVIDWTAWGGIGMATRGSIPKVMELAGIDMLPPEAGIPLIRRELTSGGTRGEIVIGQRLGILLNEWDSAGGLATDAFAASAATHGPMIGSIVSMGIHRPLTIETTLDPKVQPFLNDHQIDGTPVLPGVMGIEAFAEAAACMLPGWHVTSVENVNFVAPFKFYRNEPRTLKIEVTLRGDSDCVFAHCRLLGQRQLPNQQEPQVTTHFTGTVRLARHAPEALPQAVPISLFNHGPAVIEARDIYQVYFHGPAYQVLRHGWREGNRIVGQMPETLPQNHVPSEQSTAIAPRVVELCLQTAGLWELAIQGRFGLPQHVDELRMMRVMKGNERSLYAVVTPNAEKESFDAEVMDAAGNQYLRVKGYRTAAIQMAVDTTPLKVLQAAA